MPFPKPKAHTLQHLGSFWNLGDLVENFCRPKLVSKKKLLGSKAVDLSKVMGKDESKAMADPTSGWRSWKARHVDTEEQMDANLLMRTGSTVPEKVKTREKVKEKTKEDKEKSGKAKGERKVYDQMLIIAGELEVEIVEGGRKGKGKGKAEAKSMEVDEDIEMGTSKFMVPTLPAAHKWPLPQLKCSHQNNWATNSK